MKEPVATLDGVGFEEWREWKLNKQWLGGFAITAVPDTVVAAIKFALTAVINISSGTGYPRGTSRVTEAYNFYRHRDGSLHIINSTPRGYVKDATGATTKKTDRKVVPLEEVCDVYFQMYNQGRVNQLRSNTKSGGNGDIFKIKEFRDTMESIPEFKTLLAIEML